MVDWKKIHIFFASLGTIGGIIGFSVLTYLGNIHAALFQLLSSVPAAFQLHLHYLDYKEKLHTVYKYKHLKILTIFAMFMTVGCIAATICYFVFAHKNNIPFFPVKTSLMIAGIQAAVCIQGFLGLIFLNYKHMKKMDQQSNNTDEEKQ